MFDTTVTIVGNALNTPEWRKLESSQAVVARFKVAATSRRFDKDSGRWVDGSSLRVRVNCWRRLAENVAASVLIGDPVIVTGRLYTRDWEDEHQQRRLSYELDAFAVGHDLARGRSTFRRQQRQTLSTAAVDDDRADVRVGGESTVPLGRASDGSAVEPAAIVEPAPIVEAFVDEPPAVDAFVDEAAEEAAIDEILRDAGLTAAPVSGLDGGPAEHHGEPAEHDGGPVRRRRQRAPALT